MSVKTTNKEYRGGYVPVHEAMLLEIVSKHREQRAGYKTFVRVFAAMCEKKAVGTKSKVDLYRIVNCKSAENGCRRLSHSEIEREVKRVEKAVESARLRPERRKRPVSRKVLQALAQGKLSTSEAIALLFYASRRITQTKRMQRLNEDERYSRFKYSELQDVSGMEKSRIGEAVARLKERGLLHVVEVHQSNVNSYGLCFVDGWLLSLFRTMAEGARRALKKASTAIKKTATPLREKSNAPDMKTATLRKNNIKTLIKEKKEFEYGKNGKETLQQTLARLRTKCQLLDSGTIPQTA